MAAPEGDLTLLHVVDDEFVQAAVAAGMGSTDEIIARLKEQAENNFTLILEGLETGEHKYYYPNGRISEIRNYRFGNPEGIWKKFDQGGALILQITYQVGDEKKWDETKVPEGDENAQ